MREQLVRNVLETHQLDGLIAWAPEEIVMLTGTLPHWGLSVAFVSASEPPVLFVPRLEPVSRVPAGWEVRVYDWPWNELCEAFRKEILQLSSNQRLGWKGTHCRGALPGNFAEFPPWPANWPNCLPGQRCDAALDDLLKIKTEADLVGLRRTHRVAALALETFRAFAIPGRTEAEIAALVESAVHSETGNDAIEVSRAWACVQSGELTAKAGDYNRSSGRRLCAEDRVLMEIAVCVNGYWADLTDSIICGNGPEAVPLAPIIREASRAAIAAIRPGRKGKEIDAAAREIIAAAGYGQAFTHATGHPVGFRYHDPGPVLGRDSEEVLEEGMVLTIEPGIYLADQGIRIETNVLVTRDGAEVLGPLP